MFVYTFSPSALKKNNNIINWCQNACWRHRKNQKFCAFGEISPYVCLNSFWKYFYWRNIIISLCNKYDARRRRQNVCVFTRSLCFFHPWKLSRLSEYVLEITKKFLGLPAQIFKILVRMLNYRSNSEKPLNYQDLQEGGAPYPVKSRIFLITNMGCIFEIIKFIRPMIEPFCKWHSPFSKKTSGKTNITNRKRHKLESPFHNRTFRLLLTVFFVPQR